MVGGARGPRVAQAAGDVCRHNSDERPVSLHRRRRRAKTPTSAEDEREIYRVKVDAKRKIL